MSKSSSTPFDGLFKAKLRDNGIEYSDDDYKRFCAQLEQNFWKGTLNLSRQRIGINVLTKLTKVLRTAPFIRVFNLYGNLIRDHGIHSLLQLVTANTQVQVLDIGCNDLTDRSIPCVVDIIRATEVRSFQLGERGTALHTNKFTILSMTEIINALKAAARVQCLGFSGLKMSDRQGVRRTSAVEVLADYIAEDEALSTLVLSNNAFSLREEDVLTAQGLLLNSVLRFLDFHSNDLGDPVGPNFLGQLGRMTNLMYLDLHSCNLSEAAGKALAETLRYENKIIVLNLADNDLREAGVNEILTAVMTGEILTELDISSNHFCSSIVGEFIATNQVIYSLNVSKNSIGDVGALAVAEALPTNTSLARLSLSSCRISDVGAAKIAESVARNRSLVSLRLNDNFLTRDCGYVLIDHIRANERIRKVDLSATQIDNFVLKAMEDLCGRNVQIQKEIGLQPMKKDLIQLSIQRTKMPEAISRLCALETKRGELEQAIVDVEEATEATFTATEADAVQLRKAIQATQEQIQEERDWIEKLAVDREKSIADYDERYGEITGNTEKEKVMIEKATEDIAAVEKIIEQNAAETEKERAEIQGQIDQIRELLEQILEIGREPALLRDFEAPELLPFMDLPKSAFFVDEEILDQKEQEDAKRKKKKGKKRKASPKSGGKKGAKSKLEEGPPPEGGENVPEEAAQTMEEGTEQAPDEAAPAPASKKGKKRPKSPTGKKPATARKK
jgi:Ran GTPase-activating protein (RanGAP) involved in mRNA processing and transport